MKIITIGKDKWIALDDEVKEALSLYFHLKNHTEVQKAPMYRGMPICKICNKSAYQIMAEEWESLSTSQSEGTELMLQVPSQKSSDKICPYCKGDGVIKDCSDCNEEWQRCQKCKGTGKISS